MAGDTFFFYLHFNWPSWPSFGSKLLLNSADAIKAVRANLHEDKTIMYMYLPPFWNNLTIKCCDKIEKFKTILVKKF